MQSAEFTQDHFGWRRIDVSDAAVDLWLVDVALPALDPSSALTLSRDEIARADRFYRAEDRARFILARAALRRLLADATGDAPENLAFSLGPFDKPALAGKEAMLFNVSHSGDFALIGVSARRPIGVDIEFIRANVDELTLAEAFFCADEHRFLVDLRGAAQLDAFYRIWTCKEAVLKAFGVGITAYLKDFAVELADRKLAVRPRRDCFSPALAEVHVESIKAPAGYAAALALA